MIGVAEAHARLMCLFGPVGTEEIPLSEAGGRVLAADVVATRDQPPFPASAMDGYAARARDAEPGATLAVVGTAQAGARFAGRVEAGQAVRIFTGAPVPDGADCIVIQEDVDRTGDTISIRPNRDAGPYVRPAGGDFGRGARVAAPRRLRPSDVALLAAMGAGRATVSRRPQVALIATGDELVPAGEPAGPDQISSSNNLGLKALIEAAGGMARLLPIARDTPESLASVLGLAAGVDLIVTLGGASVGDHDLVRATAQSEGLDLDFYKVAMRPGKPLMAGRFRGTPMIGLPGNPVSAMVCGHVFLRPALERMLGLAGEMPVPVPARLGTALGSNGPRTHYMRARIAADGGGWRCTPFDRQDSSLLAILAEADALMIRPPHDPARREDEWVEFVWI